jgi:hypothetical protein
MDRRVIPARRTRIYTRALVHETFLLPREGRYRVGVSHVAYLSDSAIGLPDPLRHVDGFPVLRLLPGLRRHGANPNGVSYPLGDLALHIM